MLSDFAHRKTNPKREMTHCIGTGIERACKKYIYNCRCRVRVK